VAQPPVSPSSAVVVPADGSAAGINGLARGRGRRCLSVPFGESGSEELADDQIASGCSSTPERLKEQPAEK